MVNRQEIDQLRQKLLDRRQDLLQFRLKLNDSWNLLHEREIEFEEMAQKEVIAQGLDQLDNQERQEFEAIDRALRKIDTGLYGSCEACGANISVRRLEAIPWAPLCTACASGEGVRQPKPALEGEEEASSILPADFQGLTDEQVEAAIMEELRNDGRLDLEELEISCEDEVIYLEGALPSQEQHEILLEVVEDTLGFHDVVDHLTADRLLWERRDRASGEEVVERSPKEVLLEGEEQEDATEDPYESRTVGTPLQPPDHLHPEKEE